MKHIRNTIKTATLSLMAVLFSLSVNAATVEILDNDNSLELTSPHNTQIVPYSVKPEETPPLSVEQKNQPSLVDDVKKQTVEEVKKKEYTEKGLYDEFKTDVWQASMEEVKEKEYGFWGSAWVGFKNTMWFTGKKVVENVGPAILTVAKARFLALFI